METVTGTVGDELGPVCDTKVYVTDRKGDVTAVTSTDRNGRYAIRFDPAQAKTLRAVHGISFKPYKIPVSRIKSSRHDIILQNAPNPARTKQSSAKRQQVRKMNGQGYWTFGGNLGLGFGDYTNINIEPQIGYRFNDYLAAGFGFNYNYYDHKKYDYTLNYFGMHLYARAYPVRYVVLFVQPEIQRRWGRVRGGDDKGEVFGSLLLGGGLSIPTGLGGGINITVHYDVIQNRYSPYGDKPGYSVGYTFRL